MRLLLDSNCFIWMAGSPERLSGAARSAIEDSSNHLVVSAATYWEIAIKSALGKLGGQFDDLDAFVSEQSIEFGITDLEVTRVHALRVASLPQLHKDPFDRLLIAQALVEDLTIVTADSAIREYGVATIW